MLEIFDRGTMSEERDERDERSGSGDMEKMNGSRL